MNAYTENNMIVIETDTDRTGYSLSQFDYVKLLNGLMIVRRVDGVVIWRS